MQVSVENGRGLERTLKVQVPAERVDREVERRLKALGKSAKLKGFRPGKVPMKVLEQRYGDDVRREVVSEVMQSTYAEAVAREKLNPAAAPHIEPVNMDSGADLTYTATFEIYPEVELDGLDKLKVERPVVEVTDADLDNMVEKLRKQRADWEPVERAADEGDAVKVDYEGRLDGEPFEGGSAEAAVLEIGAGRLVEDFEKGLKGLKAGDEKTIKVKFPKDYPAEQLAGQKVEFSLNCHEVLERKLPEVDAEFARSFGVEDGDVETFRSEVRESMEREAAQAVRSRLKNDVLDAALKKVEVDLPNSLVDQEIESMQDEAVSRMGGDQRSVQDRPPRDAFEDQARRRVGLGLLIGEIIQAQNLELDRERIDKRIAELAEDYDDPEATARNLRANRNLMQRLEMMVLEEQAVDWLLDQAQVKDKKMSFDELMEPEG